jgi:arylsulfatase A-like enzyme
MKVLVIAASGLHLGYIGCYGNAWVATPALDRLAAEGVVFDQHYADCPSAGGARRAWRTGRYGLPGPEADQQPAAESPDDLLTLLREQRITTHLVVDPSRPVPAEFTQGWDYVSLVPQATGEGTPLERTIEAATQALDRFAAIEQWFLWIELALLLPPWELPTDFLDRFLREEEPDQDEEDDIGKEESCPLLPLCAPTTGPLQVGDESTFRRLQGTYAAAVAYLDAGLELLLNELEERGRLDELLLLVTADRGLALGEHGIVGEHRPWLHDELIHLPLIVCLPGAAEAGRRIPALSQSVDLVPTLLNAFGLPIPPCVHGHSLLPLMRGAVKEVRPYACAGLQIGEAMEWALRTPEWGYLNPVRCPAEDTPRLSQLYVKPDDRWEVNNVIQHHLELADHFQQTLGDFVKATQEPGPMQPPMLLRDVESEREYEEPPPPAVQGPTE